MRRDVTGVVLVGLLGLGGCGGSEEPGASPDEPVEQPAVEPPVVSPLEMMRQRDKDRPGDPAEEDAGAGGGVPLSNAAHRIARRSAFPEHDEPAGRLIPAKRLSAKDPFAEPIDEADIPDVVPWQQAKRYLGYEITVQGKIIDTGRSRDGKVNFLNFHHDWRGKFYMVVFDDLAKTLPGGVDATFRGKTLRVTGMVDDHRGQPQIKILSMDQVEFVSD